MALFKRTTNCCLLVPCAVICLILVLPYWLGRAIATATHGLANMLDEWYDDTFTGGS